MCDHLSCLKFVAFRSVNSVGEAVSVAVVNPNFVVKVLRNGERRNLYAAPK